jgi:hypothetical protein
LSLSQHPWRRLVLTALVFVLAGPPLAGLVAVLLLSAFAMAGSGVPFLDAMQVYLGAIFPLDPQGLYLRVPIGASSRRWARGFLLAGTMVGVVRSRCSPPSCLGSASVRCSIWWAPLQAGRALLMALAFPSPCAYRR